MPYPDLAIATVAYQALPRSTAAYGDNLLLALALKPSLDHDRGIVSGEKDDAETTARHPVPVRVGSHTGAEAELVGVTLGGAERVEAVALAVTASPYQPMYEPDAPIDVKPLSLGWFDEGWRRPREQRIA